jgi:hypothetical protein
MTPVSGYFFRKRRSSACGDGVFRLGMGYPCLLNGAN